MTVDFDVPIDEICPLAQLKENPCNLPIRDHELIDRTDRFKAYGTPERNIPCFVICVDNSPEYTVPSPFRPPSQNGGF